ncbi:MAG: hypothetical protein M0P71_18140 [Melioribacteraceae bacterium]|nr:hypothetical protein [Melioribacteraceae bacterium]
MKNIEVNDCSDCPIGPHQCLPLYRWQDKNNSRSAPGDRILEGCKLPDKKEEDFKSVKVKEIKTASGEDVYKIDIPDDKRVVLHYHCEHPESVFVIGFDKSKEIWELIVKEYKESE